MVGVPINFAVPGEGAVASYSWTDIADGSGIVTFYFVQTNDFASDDQILVKEALYTGRQEYVSAAGGGTSDYTQIMDVDFDLTPFNTPRTIKGNAVVSSCFGYKHTGSGSGAQGNCYLVFKLRKVSGGVETEIGSCQTSTQGNFATNTTIAPNIHLNFITTTETNFKIGDFIRVTVEGWQKYTATSGTGTIYFATNPKNTNSTTGAATAGDPTRFVVGSGVFTNSQINIPFAVDN
jgi:hypothetical protein